MIWARSRMGKAYTVRKPAPVAAGPNRDHRSRACVRAGWAADQPALHSPVCSVSGRSSSVLLIESDAPGHHVGGQLRQGTVVGERTGPQAGERLAHADAQLNRDHAGGLVDLGWGSELPIGGGVAVLGADPGPFVEQE